jgi:serpin B
MTSLTTESLNEVFDSITNGGFRLSIPKWSARAHLTLNDILSAMGMPSAFSPGADFSGTVDDVGLWLDLVEHEAPRWNSSLGGAGGVCGVMWCGGRGGG